MNKELSNKLNSPEIKLAKWARKRDINIFEIMQKASEYQTKLYHSRQSKGPQHNLLFDEKINKNSYELAKVYYTLKN